MLALLFPGQGSQEVGMGRDAFEASAASRDVFRSADAALVFDTDVDLKYERALGKLGIDLSHFVSAGGRA